MAEVTCPECERRFEQKRPHHTYDSQECRLQGYARKCFEEAQAEAQRVEHPLAEINREIEAAKSHWSMIVREGIIEVLRLKGGYHADDLHHLGIPDEHRNIIGAQTGGLVAQKWMQEVGRRKSIHPSRHGAKSGIYELTRIGREKLAEVSTGSERATMGGAPTGASADLGEPEPAALFPAEETPARTRSAITDPEDVAA